MASHFQVMFVVDRENFQILVRELDDPSPARAFVLSNGRLLLSKSTNKSK